METATLKELRAIAGRVRKEAEQRRDEFGHGPDLGGMCAIASAMLFLALRKQGYQPYIALHDRAYCHVFILLDDLIIDITATQFGAYNAVELFDRNSELGKTEYMGERIWSIQRKFCSIKQLETHQQRSGWVIDQQVCEARL